MQAKRWIAGVIVVLVLPVAVVCAEALFSDTAGEIRHLLEYLSQSECAFYRNGVWYDAEKARGHLEKKYQYLLKRGLIGSAEDFIARAATQSSLSGEAYRVRCGETVTTSAAWLSSELRSLRRKKASGAAIDF